MNKFYVYKIGILACVKIKKNSGQLPLFKITNVTSAKNATYWTNKGDAKSWEKLVKEKFPTAKLTECELKFIKQKNNE